ncbi:IclR family transcriptional regulator [Natronosalvus rutilus]|uniref:IclR family transcriptional regulator n=1 Tax=Natronosalvus rutilus TaxID=2953753 RepID=A0A9E7ND78_9EURY|nr:IclR family transcriptional regulator [Natronosalvus rutilus]UTF54815.1 IclR family transcriptional regulator [Natronosalvus rutilus]
MTAETTPMQTLVNGFDILNEIQNSNGTRLTDLATNLDLPPSTVHRYLKTLEELEYVVREGDKYQLSLRFLDHGIHARNRQQAFPLFEEKTKEIARQTGERVQFLVLEYGQAVHICHEVGEQAVQTDSRIGKRVHLHSTAAGKCILAMLPVNERDRILSEICLPKQTENTITEKDALREELDLVADRRYGINDEERIVGLRSVGVPIVGKEDVLIGAMSISGPTNRMLDDRLRGELSQVLLAVADEIKLRLTYSS